MKFLLFFTLFVSSAGFAQQRKMPEPSNLLLAGNTYNLRFYGDESEKIKTALLKSFPQQVKRKKYVWKFKNIQLQGFEGPLSFQVYEGIFGIDTTGILEDKRYLGSHYFFAFQNDSQKESRMAKKYPSEQVAITIYVKKGKKGSVRTREEIIQVESCLKNL